MRFRDPAGRTHFGEREPQRLTHHHALHGARLCA